MNATTVERSARHYTAAKLRHEARREIARRLAARQDLGRWCEAGPRTIRGAFKLKAWQRDMCRRLNDLPARIARGERPRIIIGAPPQEGKSEIVARRLPVWLMAEHGLHVALCSYAASLADIHSEAARSIASSEEAQAVWPHLKPQGDQKPGARVQHKGEDGRPIADTVQRWFVPSGIKGNPPIGYIARGVGAGISGLPVDVAIIDDPFADMPDADSAASRAAVWAWYTSAIHARVNNSDGAVIIMHTRWNDDDLVARVLEESKESGEVWEVWNYPVIALANDLLNREPGVMLDGWTDRKVKETKAKGSRLWEAAYQQQPTPETGAIFQREWFDKRHRFTPALAREIPWDSLVISADLTFDKGDDADDVAMHVWGRRAGEFYLLDRVAGKMSYVEARRAFLDLCAAWPKAWRKLVEKAANGAALCSDLERAVPGVIAVKVAGGPSKRERARSITPMLEAKNVWYPDSDIPGGDFMGKYVENHIKFTGSPGGVDDDIDAESQALTDMMEGYSVPTADDHARAATTMATFGGGAFGSMPW